jgi:hypothetical protein
MSDIPMACGFVYLKAIVDWASRRVPARRVAITQEKIVMLPRRWRTRSRNTACLTKNHESCPSERGHFSPRGSIER